MEAVRAVRDIGEVAGVCDPDLHVAAVRDLAAGVEVFHQARLLRVLHVDDRHALVARADVGVGPDHVAAVRAARHVDLGALDQLRLRVVGQVDDAQALARRDEAVAELDRDLVRIGDLQLGADRRLDRIGEVDGDQRAIGQQVAPLARQREVAGAGQLAARIEGQGPLDLVVDRITVKQRRRVDEDQTLVAVADVEEGVEQADRLLLVLLEVLAGRVDAHGRRRVDIGRVARRHVQVLADRRERRRCDALREALVVDVGDVEDPQALVTGRAVKVFAAVVGVQHLAAGEEGQRPRARRVRVADLQHAAVRLVLLVLGREGVFVQRRADDGLGLVALADDHGLDAALAVRHVDILAEEVVGVGALHEHHGHLGVVVVVLRDVAVGALLRVALAADRVGVARREGLAGVALRGDGLLLAVDVFAVGVLGADVDGAGRAGRRDPAAHDRVVATQHEHVLTQRLEGVVRPVARVGQLVVQEAPLVVGLHRQVAAEAGGHPRAVAGVAVHVRVGVGELVLRGRIAPGLAVLLDGLGERRLLAVFRVARRDRVDGLRDLPLEAVGDVRALQDLLAAAGEARLAEGRLHGRQVRAALGRRRAAGLERRPLVGGAVAVAAVDLDGVAHGAVELAVAVAVLQEVAVDAVHALLEVDVLEVDGLRELVRIVGGDDLALAVDEQALVVHLVDRLVDPAVAVEVRELRRVQAVLHGVVEVGHVEQEVLAPPLAADDRALRVEVVALLFLLRRDVGLPEPAVIGLGLGIHEVGVQLVVPPHVSVVGLGDAGAGVHVTDDALRGRDRAGELVLERVAALVLRDGRVLLLRAAVVAELGDVGRVDRVAVVGVESVAGRAAARAVVTGLVVRAHVVERRVEQAGLLDADPHRVGAEQGAEAALRQALEDDPAGLVVVLEADEAAARQRVLGDQAGAVRRLAAAALEHAQDVGGLTDLEARQRLEVGQHALGAGLLLGRRRHGLQPLRRAVAGVGLAEVAALEREGAVVVERRAPQVGAVGHHRLADVRDLLDVTARGAAGEVRDAQVAGVHEADELPALLVEIVVAVARVGRRLAPDLGVLRQNVSPVLGLVVVRRALEGVRRGHDVGVAAVTVRAADRHRRRLVHGLRVDLGVTGHAARRRGLDIGLRLRRRVTGRHRRRRLGRPRLDAAPAAAAGQRRQRQQRGQRSSRHALPNRPRCLLHRCVSAHRVFQTHGRSPLTQLSRPARARRSRSSASSCPRRRGP